MKKNQTDLGDGGDRQREKRRGRRRVREKE
jgi:hypothetical protein